MDVAQNILYNYTVNWHLLTAAIKFQHGNVLLFIGRVP